MKEAWSYIFSGNKLQIGSSLSTRWDRFPFRLFRVIPAFLCHLPYTSRKVYACTCVRPESDPLFWSNPRVVGPLGLQAGPGLCIWEMLGSEQGENGINTGVRFKKLVNILHSLSYLSFSILLICYSKWLPNYSMKKYVSIIFKHLLYRSSILTFKINRLQLLNN